MMNKNHYQKIKIMKNEIKYIASKWTVYCKKVIIAQTYLNRDGTSHVRVLQGMDRMETIKKICRDCPEFVKRTGINENYFPYVFAQ